LIINDYQTRRCFHSVSSRDANKFLGVRQKNQNQKFIILYYMRRCNNNLLLNVIVGILRKLKKQLQTLFHNVILIRWMCTTRTYTYLPTLGWSESLDFHVVRLPVLWDHYRGSRSKKQIINRYEYDKTRTTSNIFVLANLT